MRISVRSLVGRLIGCVRVRGRNRARWSAGARGARRPRVDPPGTEAHPAGILRHVACIDTESGEEFRFHLDDPASGWYWQRDVLDWWIANRKTVVLKARQLGITWLAGGFALWHLLFRPGTRVLAVSINEKEASKLVRRIWVQYKSLPAGLCEVRVLKPARGVEPSDTIEVSHPDGRISTILALPSTKTAGHGETAALVILDEFARQEYASETWKAVLPTASKGGRILVISTGNGISVGEGQGNYFHHVYKHAEALGIASKFLRWDLHPDREEAWYGREAMALPSAEGVSSIRVTRTRRSSSPAIRSSTAMRWLITARTGASRCTAASSSRAVVRRGCASSSGVASASTRSPTRRGSTRSVRTPPPAGVSTIRPGS